MNLGASWGDDMFGAVSDGRARSATGDGAAGDLSRRDGQLQTRSSTSPFAMVVNTA
jgi:hypothetical protein